MNSHQNARTTARGRALLVSRILAEGWRVADAARAAGISVRTAYKWLARFRAGGERMLRDRSSAPARPKGRITPAVCATIATLRRNRMTGQAIADRLPYRAPRLAPCCASSASGA